MLLTVHRLEASYGQSQALFGVDLAVSEGEVIALMGRNGMGKTTTIAAILGLVRPHGGSVRFSGQEISRLSAHRTARLGIGLVPKAGAASPI
jgi:branched-chain amino acid transport system ATP-binding protein